MKLKIYQPNGIIGVVLKWGITLSISHRFNVAYILLPTVRIINYKN